MKLIPTRKCLSFSKNFTLSNQRTWKKLCLMKNAKHISRLDEVWTTIRIYQKSKNKKRIVEIISTGSFYK